MYLDLFDGHLMSVELDDSGKEIRTALPYESAKDDNIRHPFSRIANTPLLNLVATQLDKAFPHLIKSITSLEKNPQQKYGTSPQFYSQGKELVIEVGQEKPYTPKKKDSKVYTLNPMEYCLFPQDSHPRVFTRIERHLDNPNSFMYVVNGIWYALPAIVIPEWDGKTSLPQVLCSQYLSVLNEYYLCASDLQNPEIQKRMMEASMLVKRFLISVACEYLGAVAVYPIQENGENITEKLGEKYCFNLY